ncbi:hypothetical protein L1049_010801 [Liquidambar formosana]|uniref:RING-type domain-containing protein n=1 Tax=Liquidambar formosana TaxID=63359 RepID=A0AAP0RQ33_LIQFO
MGSFFLDDLLPFAIGASLGVSAIIICNIYCCCGRMGRRTAQNPPPLRRLQSLKSKAIETHIPAHKYQKGEAAGAGSLIGEDGTTCAICLSEVEEGEDLRTLRECMHSFHVPCIDMWLYSHPNCPICREPQMIQHSPDCGSGGLETQDESTMLPEIVIQP